MRRVAALLVVALLGVLGLAGCTSSGPRDGTRDGVGFGARPVSPECRGDADDPQPGDVICFTGELDDPLKISVGGTPEAPIVYSVTARRAYPGSPRRPTTS